MTIKEVRLRRFTTLRLPRAKKRTGTSLVLTTPRDATRSPPPERIEVTHSHERCNVMAPLVRALASIRGLAFVVQDQTSTSEAVAYVLVPHNMGTESVKRTTGDEPGTVGTNPCNRSGLY